MEEPQISFHHATLKIEWSKILISDLNWEIERFIERKPYTISLEPDPQGGGYLFQVSLTEHIPYEIPCLIGDTCHNLRASADFCWMGLRRSIDPNVGKDNLPICSNVKGIKTTINKIFEGETLQRVEDLLVHRIKSHHDFDAGGDMHLSDLNHLSNWQKHNMLVPAFAVTELGDNTIIKSNDGSMIDLSGAKVNGRVAGIGGTHAEISYDSEPTVKVFIHLKYFGGYQPVIGVLGDFLKTSAESVNAFQEVFSV